MNILLKIFLVLSTFSLTCDANVIIAINDSDRIEVRFYIF